jgi:phosphatidylserine/phosphatidylglycerophosphate/cardiolipin synthase-like enzyme
MSQSVTQGSDIKELTAAGVSVVMDKDGFHMHHKFCILDSRMVLNGSFNWTRQAVLSNQENILVLDHPQLVSALGGRCRIVHHSLCW